MENILYKNNLLNFLVTEGKLAKDQAERILGEVEKNKRDVVDVLLAKAVIDEISLRDLLASYTNLKVGDVPYGLSLKTYQFLNFVTAYQYRIVSFYVSDEVVKIACDNPLNLEMQEVIDFLSRAKQVKIEYYVVTRSELIQLLANYQKLLLERGLLEEPRVELIEKKYGVLGTDIQTAVVGRKKDEIHKAETEQVDQEKKQEINLEQSENEDNISDLEMQAEAEARILQVEKGVMNDEGYSDEQKSWLKLLQDKVESIEQLKKIINSRDIPRIVASFVHYAILVSASDIHIEPMVGSIRVRYRIDGVLQEILELDKSLLPALISRIKILALLKIDEHRIPQDGQFRVTFEGRMVDLRISSLPTVYGEKVVIRILDVSSGRLTLDELGLQGVNKEKVAKNILRSNGMILSTGPTGSGKSTSLFSILGMVSLPGVNVVTLEDPVEYHIPGVNQVQIRPDIGFTFATGLRSILRQDPNVVMVGEIRDSETAELAVHASLTGHLVLSTLHTNDAPSAIPRLIDMGIEPFLISSSLVLVMAQRLTRKICDHCRTELDIPENKKEEIVAYLQNVPKEHLEKIGIDLQNIKFYRGLGCSYCHNSGYKGRIGVFEVLEISDALHDLTIKKASGVDIFDQAVKEGMITMRQDGFMKAMQGITTLDEVYRVTTK